MKSLVRLAVNVIQRLVAPGSCILLAGVCGNSGRSYQFSG